MSRPRTSSSTGSAIAARFEDGEEDSPFARGKLRMISRARFTGGPLAGYPCVVKWFANNQSNKNAEYEALASGFANTVVDLWNERASRSRQISVNSFARWIFANYSGNLKGQSVLIERFLPDFQHWNSNSGWADTKSRWGRLMQALSHFSYHASAGKNLLCDLQGSFASDGSAIITNPVVCSKAREFGLSDLGNAGIRNYFHYHQCNEYCNSQWIKPRKITKHFSSKKSTTYWDSNKCKYVSRYF